MSRGWNSEQASERQVASGAVHGAPGRFPLLRARTLGIIDPARPPARPAWKRALAAAAAAHEPLDAERDRPYAARDTPFASKHTDTP